MRISTIKIVGAWLTLLLWSALTYAGTVTYVYTDAQGTPLAEADTSGNITATFDYAPYGSQALGSPRSGPGYTGHVNDSDTGLVYMQARYYDPAVGRFLSVDPVTPSPGDAFNFNRYDYASNNPIVNIDPDGRSVSGWVHAGLGAASFCPSVCGSGFSAVDGVVYAAQGDKVNAGISFGAAGIGLVSDAGLVKAAAMGVKEGAAALKAARGANAVAKEITLTAAAHGEAAVHAADAINAGKSDVLTIARDGAAANRKAAIGGMEKVPGKQLDEYPPAMFKEGGSGASVRAIKSSDNMSAGACIGNACRGLPNGTKIRIRVEGQ